MCVKAKDRAVVFVPADGGRRVTSDLAGQGYSILKENQGVQLSMIFKVKYFVWLVPFTYILITLT